MRVSIKLSIWITAFLIFWFMVKSVPICFAAEEEVTWGGDFILWGEKVKWVPQADGINETTENPKILKTYDASNVDEIKQYIPIGFYDSVKDPDIYGKIKVVLTETIKIPIYEGFREITEKHKGMCKIDEKGMLLNWKGGLPFPEPKTAMEVYWNFEMGRPRGDDFTYPFVEVITDRKGNQRMAIGEWNHVFYVGRTNVPPIPEIPDNPEGKYFEQGYGHSAPYDVRGVSFKMIRYLDIDRDDDQWIYIPTLRRVRRMSTAQRMDVQSPGGDGTYDDMQCFNGKVTQYDWKLLPRKEMIMPRCGKSKPTHRKGELASGVDEFYQKVNVYILEYKPKNPNHIYSHCNLYLDPETFQPLVCEYFDRQKRLWKMNWNYNIWDAKWQFSGHPYIVDIIRRHSTTYEIFDQKCNKGYKPEMFTMTYLREIYSGR